MYADEPADPAYGTIEDEVQGGAIAILLNGEATTGQLVCTLSGAGEPGAAPAAQENRADAGNIATAEASAEASPEDSFATQSQALQHCLETGRAAVWQGAGAAWHWRWHERAA